MTFVNDILNRERLPTPLEQIGIGGFSLFARVSDRLTLSAENPTTYVEDGSPLNDQRIRKPELLTIRGSIGDVYRAPSTSIDRVQNIDNNLAQITQYVPRLTGTQAIQFSRIASNAISRIEKIGDLISAGTQANKLLGNLDTLSKSLGEQFIDAMENIHYSNQLISIQMPYRIYDSMSIKTIVIDGSNTKRGIDFTIEAERFRVADLNFVAVERVSTGRANANGSTATAQRVSRNPAPALNGQTETVKEKGSQEGRSLSDDEVRSSALSDIVGLF